MLIIESIVRKRTLNAIIAANMGISLENVGVGGGLDQGVDPEEIDAEEQDREVEGEGGGDLGLLAQGLDQGQIILIQDQERGGLLLRGGQ